MIQNGIDNSTKQTPVFADFRVQSGNLKRNILVVYEKAAIASRNQIVCGGISRLQVSASWFTVENGIWWDEGLVSFDSEFRVSWNVGNFYDSFKMQPGSSVMGEQSEEAAWPCDNVQLWREMVW